MIAIVSSRARELGEVIPLIEFAVLIVLVHRYRDSFTSGCWDKSVESVSTELPTCPQRCCQPP